MRRVCWVLRRGAMVGVAVASVAGAAGLIWVFVTRDQVQQLSNAHLLAFLALFILPGATFASWLLERKAAREEPESTLEENGLFERPAGVEIEEGEAGEAVGTSCGIEAPKLIDVDEVDAAMDPSPAFRRFEESSEAGEPARPRVHGSHRRRRTATRRSSR